MAPLELAPGTVVGDDFVVESVLARGGMGVVYVALQKSTQKRRAVKVMTPQPGDLEVVRKRFEREAHVSSQIDSEHVVEVIGAGVDARTELAWLAMELLDGEDVEHYLARRGRLGWIDTWNVVAEACHALEAAHRLGVVHRDLKPSNVFLARSRRPGVAREVKVLDFGIAKRTSDASKTTGTLGTPLYMAPEQTLAGAPVSPATDVWALGLLVFEMLVGIPYWKAASTAEAQIGSLLREIILEPLEPATARAAALGVEGCLPPGFDGWFARCVTRDTAERHADAGVAYRTLATLLAAATGRDPHDVPPAPGDGRPVVRAIVPPGAPSTAGAPSSADARTQPTFATSPPITAEKPRSRLGLLAVGTTVGVLVAVGAFVLLHDPTAVRAPATAAESAPRVEPSTLGVQPVEPAVAPSAGAGPRVDAPGAPSASASSAPASASASAPASASASSSPRPRTTAPPRRPPAAPAPPPPPRPPTAKPPKDPVIL